MLVFLIILLLVALVFGLGTALEVAFWTLLVAVAALLLVGLAARSVLRRL